MEKGEGEPLHGGEEKEKKRKTKGGEEEVR
jgi:hypothetical protein